MPFSPETYDEKPYNRCLNCAHIGSKCDGPNFLAMDMARLSEWCRLRKEYLHTLDPKWTNAFIADQALMSKTSVDRFLSGNVDDIKMSTVARILRVLVNGSWGQYPCATEGVAEVETVYMDNPDLVQKVEQTEAELKRLQSHLEHLTDEHRMELATAHNKDEERVDYLKEQIKFKDEQLKAKDKLLEERYDFIKRKDKYIFVLAVLLFVCLAVIITALVVDRLNSDVGFFWRTAFGFTQNTRNLL